MKTSAEIRYEDRLLLILNQHGFVWASENDWSAFDEWQSLGYCIDTELMDSSRKFKRYEITVLGVHNALNLHALLESAGQKRAGSEDKLKWKS